ncbi:MAG: hypothetical protein K0R19_1020 [Bacillota bacterium]|jgi:hypothetical protein|nr:hypothetical protein [Bacillota bacterium]
MKQFIVLMGVLPIMLVFLFQYALDQKNNDRINRFQEYVYQAKEQAKQEGCFTPKIKSELTDKIEGTFGIQEEEMILVLEQVPQYRTAEFDERELIYYKVAVPIEKIMAGNRFFGISDEDNRGMYTIESWTASELLRD